MNNQIFAKGKNFVVVVVEDHFEVKTSELQKSAK
jgi:hypothetical protein